MKSLKAIVMIFLILCLAGLLSAQLSKYTGNIVGTVTEEGGAPLPGVNIIVEGPNLQGKLSAVSGADGSYKIRGLPPGEYVLVASLQSFQTIRREKIVIRVGTTVEINVRMNPSAIAEEITVIGGAPTVDIRSTKITLTMNAEAMSKLPTGRSLYNIIETAPGVVRTPISLLAGTQSHFMVHGGTGISQTLDVDGVNANWPADYGIWLGEIGYDSMEEVEVVTGGILAEETVPGGALINVVTKSGGNAFHGRVQAYYTNEHLNQFLFSDEYINSAGLAKPSVAVYDYETAFQLGGPILEDKLWFFTDLGYQTNKNHSPFIPTTLFGVNYGPYDYQQKYYKGFLKFSFRVSDKLRGFLMGSYVKKSDPKGLGGTRTIPSAIQDYKDVRTKLNSALTYFISDDLFLDFRLGLSGMEDWILPPAGSENSPQYYDAWTGYTWGSPYRLRHSRSDNLQGSLDVTYFNEELFGAKHEFKAGFLYQHIYYKWPWFRKDPRYIYYYDGSPYYWRAIYGLSGPHSTLGDSLVRILFCAPNDGESYSRGDMLRFGGFLQDSLTIKNRLTLNLGLRYDYYYGYLPSADKKASAPLAEAIGAYALTPLFGFNALGAMHMDEWKPALKWGAFSPRFGFIYDLFGTGKTAVKGSFSIYTDFMSTMYFDTSHPFREYDISFNWFDKNKNGVMDFPPTDHYVFYDYSKNPKTMDPSYYKETIGKNVKSPLYWEYTLGVDHELTKDFMVGVKYINKTKTNTVDDTYYDLATGKGWYTYELAPQYWIPFTTIIPGIKNYPAQEVTLYFMSKNAPSTFRQFMNIPEAKRKYQGFQFSFDKRMSNGWSLGGSAVISRTLGNNAGAYGSVWGYGGAYNTPNWWVNRYGRTDEDRPYILKLYGSFELPYRFILSFYSEFASGSPFQRTVTVYPPAAWAAKNNAQLYSYNVNVEKQGSRRNPNESNLDIRLEKEIGLSRFGKIGLFVDVFNLFGSRYLTIPYDPAGRWMPVDENTNKGTYTVDTYYGKVTGSRGQRIFKLSVRYTF